MPFDGRAWETVDQLLVDVGSRTITQWHYICESAGGIRESHVFVESTLLRVAAKDEGRKKGEEGSRFPGNQVVTSFASTRGMRLYYPGRRWISDGITNHFLLRHNIRCIQSNRCIRTFTWVDCEFRAIAFQRSKKLLLRISLSNVFQCLIWRNSNHRAALQIWSNKKKKLISQSKEPRIYFACIINSALIISDKNYSN